MATLVSDPRLLARRRALVRTREDLLGIDFIDVEVRGRSSYRLHVHFLGAGAVVDSLQRQHFVFSPGLPAPASVIERGVAASGDATLVLEVSGMVAPLGVHTLRLVPPPGIIPAPFFDRAEFRFDLDGPTARQEARASEVAAVVQGPPPIDYRKRDYRGFRALMLDRIATLVPGRQEHHPADLLTVLVENFAYVADQLSYYQDAVATEAYLGTARRRVSVRRHARLLGYFMHEGVNARAFVAIRVAAAVTEPVELPQGTPILTHVQPARPVIAPGDYPRAFEAQSPVVFETQHAALLRPELNVMPLYGWGAREFSLEAGATTAHLVGALADALMPGDVLLLQELWEGTEEGAAPAVHAVRLTGVDAASDPLGEDLELDSVDTDSPGPVALTRVTWHVDDALPSPLRVVAAGGEQRACALGNVVLADHGRTIDGESLPGLPRDEGARYRPRLARRPLTHAVPYDHRQVREALGSARQCLITDPRQAVPSVRLSAPGAVGSDDEAFLPRRDLLDAGGDSRAFVVEVESDGIAWLRFGDGVYGSKPTAGLSARYRIGSGSVGNVGAGALRHIVTDVPGIEGVTNPLPAVGGVEPETIQQVRIRAPQAHKVRVRSTTAQDYATLVRQFAGVARATASASRGRPVPIAIQVERVGRQPLEPGFVDRLLAFLEPARMMGHRLSIAPARYLGVDLTITAVTEPGYRAGPVRVDLMEAFSSLDFGNGRRGFFHPGRFDFGDSLLLSDLRAQALAVPGVSSVTLVVRPALFDEASALSIPERVIRPAPDQILRLDNDPEMPEFGLLTLHVGEGAPR